MTRTTVTGLKQQPNNAPKPPAGPLGGLAAAMHTASKQEQMMPGHRLREKAAGQCREPKDSTLIEKTFLSVQAMH